MLVANRRLPHHQVHFFQQWQWPDWNVLPLAERTSFIEYDDNRMPVPIVLSDRMGTFLLRFSFFSRRCYLDPVADWVCMAACERYPHWQALASGLQIVIQELMMNALIHSNWEIDSHFHDMEQFSHYCEALQHKAADPDYAMRRIDMCFNQSAEQLEVAVFSEGRPFQKEAMGRAGQYGGRGLALIEACGGVLDLHEGERKVGVRFSLPHQGDERALPTLSYWNSAQNRIGLAIL